MKKIVLTVLLAAGVIGAITLIVLRNQQAPAGQDKLSVAASFYPLYNFAQRVGGDNIAALNLTPAGAEAHDYEPSPKTITDTLDASVFIYNGGHFEPWVDSFLKDYRHTPIKASQGIDLMKAEGEDDPHFWLDPVLAQVVVTNIQDGLIQADPDNEVFYRENAAAYLDELKKLDAAYTSGLATCKLRTVISSHEALSYLGKRYNLTIEPIAGISPEEEPSAAALAALSQLVKQKGIDYIFFETLASPRLADTIATETGAKTLVFNPIEGLTDEEQKEGKDYLSVQYENLKNLRTALACE